MARHVRAMVEFQDAGAEVFDYGNSIRDEARKGGYDRAFEFPGFVPAYIRPLFCEGKGPFRWAALSGDPEDIYATDRAIKELFPADEKPEYARLHAWLDMAAERVQFQGLPARICWLGYGDRAKAGAKFNEMVASGELKAPVVIGRDHLDCGSVASPYRETEAMLDGSDAIADWAILNALVNTASGATWVSFHHGGGVGIGRSLHAGQVTVADGTELAAEKIERVLTNDPGMGVIRHVDAGYDRAVEVAEERGVDGPDAARADCLTSGRRKDCEHPSTAWVRIPPWPRGTEEAGACARRTDGHQLAGVGAPRRQGRAGRAAQAQGLRRAAQDHVGGLPRAGLAADAARLRGARRRAAVRAAAPAAGRGRARASTRRSLPEMYVQADPTLSAQTVGMDRPIIVLSSGLVHHLDDDELRFVIGHELGHAISGHAVYRTLLLRLLGLGGLLNAIPGGALGIRMVTVGLLEWSRKAELSADRAGLLASQDPTAALRTHMKLASGGTLDELDVTSFLAQGAEYDEGGDVRESLIKLSLLQQQTPPVRRRPRDRAAPLDRLRRLHRDPRRRLPAPRGRRRGLGQRGRPGGGGELRRRVRADPGHPRPARPRPRRLDGHGQHLAQRPLPPRRRERLTVPGHGSRPRTPEVSEALGDVFSSAATRLGGCCRRSGRS